MEILAIIPARGGSTRLPCKNIKLLNGKPLIAYTIEVAQKSTLLTRIVVSTDDDDIGKVVREYGAEVINCPSRLHTGDEIGIINITNHAIEYLARFKDYHPQVVVILQPTSPLRSTEDIDATISLLLDSGCESAETMCDGLENGAVYASRTSVFTLQRKVSGRSYAIYRMPKDRSVDINTLDDFFEAERLLSSSKIIEDPIMGDNKPKKKRGKRK